MDIITVTGDTADTAQDPGLDTATGLDLPPASASIAGSTVTVSDLGSYCTTDQFDLEGLQDGTFVFAISDCDKLGWRYMGFTRDSAIGCIVVSNAF